MASASTLNAGNPPLRPVAARAGEPGGAPDPQLVAEMKHEIRVLVQEVAQLAAQEVTSEEFFAGFLPRVVAAMAAVSGAVWTPAEGGELKLTCQVNLDAAGVDDAPQSRLRHELLLRGILEGSQAVLVPPGSLATPPAAGQKVGSEAGNPTNLLIVAAPVIVEREALAVVEIFQRPGAAAATQRGYLRFLAQMCDMACDYFKSRRLRQLAESQTLWRQLEEVVESIHRSLDVRETAYAIVNEGRRIIGCDRVSLALTYGRWRTSCRIEAVSGLDSIDRRAAEVNRLARLAGAVLRTGELLWSKGGQEELPPQIQEPLNEYVDQSHARMVAVLPLAAPPERHGGLSLQRVVGALIVEQISDTQVTEALRTRAEALARHSATALANAIEHNNLFLLPLWKALGRATWFVGGTSGGLVKTILAVALLAGGVLTLATVPTDFEVRARGKLQPAERREIFAPLDGVVVLVPVEHGQIVEVGAVLAELSNTDLDLEIAGLLGRQTTNQERLAAVERALLDTRSGTARLSPADENRLAGEVIELRQEAQSIERELALLREKQQQLCIEAPRRGQVVTWKVRELLLQRPVSRGQGLMTLVNPEGTWELELYLPERRIKHVQAGGWVCLDGNPSALWSAAAADHSHPGATRAPDLPVTFALSSHPGQTFQGHVMEIEQVAEVRGDEGNTVLVRVAVDKERLPHLHDQTTVTAKLHCGRTSIGYAWFCDLIETIQTKVLFWMPA